MTMNVHRRHFLKAYLSCPSIQLTKNLFTEVKLKLHGFH